MTQSPVTEEPAAKNLTSAAVLHLNHYDEFIEKSQRILQNAAPDERFAVLYADIVDFQTINTFYGYAEGDRMLAASADFMSQVPGARVYGRVFSDHFLCLIQIFDLDNSAEISAKRREALLKFLDEQLPYHADCQLHIACGLCLVNGLNLVDAVDDANIARKRGKSYSDTTIVWFDEQIKQQVAQEKLKAHSALTALREKRYCFYLQPKVNLHTGRIIGAEALARGIGADGKMIPPDSFIPSLEQNGSIIEMDFLIFHQVCEYLSKRLQNQLPVVTISVNLSRLHTRRNNTAQLLHQTATEYNIPPALLEFELTETLLLKEFDSTKRLMDELRSYGYKISIDDFGSGYAGINIWQELDFDILKLDKKFLSDNPQVKPRNDALIPNLIRIANELHTTVLCEGAEQCAYLDRMGCSIVQGYYFSKPLPCSQFNELLEKNHESHKVQTAQSLHTPDECNLSNKDLSNSIFQAIPGGAAGFDEVTGQMLFAVGDFTKLAGRPVRELYSCATAQEWMQKLLSPQTLSTARIAWKTLQQTGTARAAITFQQPNGRFIPTQMYARRVEKTHEREHYLLCCFIDLSNSKNT